MKTLLRWTLAAIGTLALCGCDDKKPTVNVTPSNPSTAATATNGAAGAGTTTTGGVGNGSISGKVAFDGMAPAPKVINMAGVPQCAALHNKPVLDDSIVVGPKGELKDVVVYVKNGEKLGGTVPKTPVILDQVGCMYSPHVATVMVGQEFKARNSDGFLHNVHGLCQTNPEFNFPQTQKGQETAIPANQAAETYKVKCDVHPWMNAWVVVLDHPFSAVTSDDGTFTIKGLKDGKYHLVAWHQKLGQQEADVEIKGGVAVSDFKFAPKK